MTLSHPPVPLAPDRDRACFECRGACCSFRFMNVVFTEHHPDEGLESVLEREAFDWTQLLLASGEYPPKMAMLHDAEDGLVWLDCGHRTAEGRCGVYEDRPGMCRTFECSALKGNESLEAMLERAEPREKGEVLFDCTSIVRAHALQAAGGGS